MVWRRVARPRAAGADPDLAAAVIDYGQPASDDGLKKINASMLAGFAAHDRGIPPADSKKFGESLDQFGKKINIRFTTMPATPSKTRTTKTRKTKTDTVADAAEAWNRTFWIFSPIG